MSTLSLLAAFKSGFFLSDFSIIHDSYFIIQYLLLTAIFATLLLITLYDLRHFIIPDAFLIAFLVFAFLHNSLFIIHDSFSYISYLASLASGLAIAFPFLAIFIISKGRWIGFGDIKYIAVIGFWLSFASGLSAVILAFWIGAAFSIFALVVKKFKSQISLPLFKNNLTIKSEIPFGPFLSLGTIISFYFNADLFQIKSLLELF